MDLIMIYCMIKQLYCRMYVVSFQAVLEQLKDPSRVLMQRIVAIKNQSKSLNFSLNYLTVKIW